MTPLKIKLSLQQAENVQAALAPFLQHIKLQPLKRTKLDITMAIDLLEALFLKLDRKVYNQVEVVKISLRTSEQLALYKLIPLIKSQPEFHQLDLSGLDLIYTDIDKRIINI